MFEPHYQAYKALKYHAIELDLEKYQDIYEISRTDLEDAAVIADADVLEIEAADTLHDLKLGIERLHILRKLVLCALLALDADGGQLDFVRWPAAIEAMSGLSSLTSRFVAHVDEALCEEQGRQSNKQYVLVG